MRICSVQMHNSSVLETNVSKITRFLAQGAQEDCSIAVFPECAVTGFSREIVSSLEYPEKIGDNLSTIGDACKTFNIMAIVGTPLSEKGEWYNAAVVFGRNGDQIARVGKRKLTSPEATIFKPWPEGQTFEIEHIKCRTIFCKEAYRPELIEDSKPNNTAILFWLSYYSPTVTNGQGYENNCVQQGIDLARLFRSYVVQSNWANSADDKNLSLGSSVIVSPDCTLLAQGEIGKEQILVVEMKHANALVHKILQQEN